MKKRKNNPVDEIIDGVIDSVTILHSLISGGGTLLVGMATKPGWGFGERALAIGGRLVPRCPFCGERVLIAIPLPDVADISLQCQSCLVYTSLSELADASDLHQPTRMLVAEVAKSWPDKRTLRGWGR